MKIQLTVAYDGAAFSGWQSQPHGKGVQDALERALGVVCQRQVRTHAAGRTDAGVHATGQVAHFEVPDSLRLTSEQWIAALNSNLPAKLRILAARERPETFHARFSCLGKTYEYIICCEKILPPCEAGRAWHLPNPPSTATLRETLELFLGNQDFRAFTAGKRVFQRGTRRTITRIAVKEKGSFRKIEISGDGFLYKMVRSMVGTAVNVALGKVPENFLTQRLDGTTQERSHLIAPADGLTLARAFYAPARLPSMPPERIR